MGNGIVERQNEDQYINYLGAQRQLYNEAKKSNTIVLLFSVILPLVFAGIQLIVNDNNQLNVASYTLSIISMVISLCLSSCMKRKKNLQLKFNNILIHMCIKCHGMINCLVGKGMSHTLLQKNLKNYSERLENATTL